MKMNELRFKLTGMSALLMHSDKLVNALSDEAKNHARLIKANKTSKTDQGYRLIARSEWEAGMYFDETLGPYVPGQNLRKCLQQGAKMTKKGKDVARAAYVMEDKVPLEYKGPRDLDTMYASGKYMDVRSVKGGTTSSRVMRCRPLFQEWSLSFSLLYNTGILQEDDIVLYMTNAGSFIGLGDYRPDLGGMFGRFSVEKV